MTQLAVKQNEGVDDVYNSAEEQARLDAILGPFYEAMLNLVHQLVAQAFADVIDLDNFRVDDAATNRILLDAGARIVRINETTRQAIARQLQIGQERGYSNFEIAHGVASDGYPGINGLFKETWASRAETVARTELQHAQTQAAKDRYVATGVVDRVEIIDGDEWDATCRNRNGKIVPLEQAPSLAHPNCTLVLLPLLRVGLVEEGP